MHYNVIKGNILQRKGVTMASEQFSLRLSKKTKDMLQALADATGRTKAFLAQDAIERYLELESWQIKSIQDGIKNVEEGNTVSIDNIKEEWGIE